MHELEPAISIFELLNSKSFCDAPYFNNANNVVAVVAFLSTSASLPSLRPLSKSFLIWYPDVTVSR